MRLFYFRERVAMNYKLTFTISIDERTFEVDAYAMNVVNGIPTRFQILVNNAFEGFISYTNNEWIIDKYSLSPGLLTENLVQEIGNYLMAYYE